MPTVTGNNYKTAVGGGRAEVVPDHVRARFQGHLMLNHQHESRTDRPLYLQNKHSPGGQLYWYIWYGMAYSFFVPFLFTDKNITSKLIYPELLNAEMQ